MGVNLEIYIMKKEVDKFQLLVENNQTEMPEAEDHIIFDKETYFNNQIHNKLRGYRLVNNFLYNGKTKMIEDDYGGRYLVLKAKRFNQFDVNTKLKENKDLLNKIKNLEPNRVLIIGYT